MERSLKAEWTHGSATGFVFCAVRDGDPCAQCTEMHRKRAAMRARTRLGRIYRAHFVELFQEELQRGV